eukprot:scaffold38562_cov64-Cyclotella_meneghiniana.AAC.1
MKVWYPSRTLDAGSQRPRTEERGATKKMALVINSLVWTGLSRLFPQDDDITIDHCKGWASALPPALFRLVLRSAFDIRSATEDDLKSFILDESKEKLIDPTSHSRAYIKAVIRAKVRHHKSALVKMCHESSAVTASERKRAGEILKSLSNKDDDECIVIWYIGETIRYFSERSDEHYPKTIQDLSEMNESVFVLGVVGITPKKSKWQALQLESVLGGLQLFHKSGLHGIT